MPFKGLPALLIVLVFLQYGKSENSLEQGWSLFHQCIQGKVPGKNLEQVLDSAMEIFHGYLDNPQAHKKASIGIMRCILVKGNEVPLNKKQKKILYQLGKKMGTLTLNKYPNDGDVIYWYIACLGRWAESVGILKAARQGVADKVKGLSEKLINLKSTVMRARGHRILGRVHYKAPYIPFILTWPSNKKSLQHLKKSVQLDSANLATLQFLAEVYHKEGEKALALKTVQRAVNLKVREAYKLSDQRRQRICKELLKKWSKK